MKKSLAVLLIIFTLTGCKSRKLAIDKSQTTDKSEIAQNSTVAEKTTTVKVDSTITVVTKDETRGTITTEKYQFATDTARSEKMPVQPVYVYTGGLPLHRLKSYEKTTETFESNKGSSSIQNSIKTDSAAQRDSSGTSVVKKNVTTETKSKKLEAEKGSNWWILWLVLLLVALAAVAYYFKKKIA